jgi:hypothetical protein
MNYPYSSARSIAHRSSNAKSGSIINNLTKNRGLNPQPFQPNSLLGETLRKPQRNSPFSILHSQLTFHIATDDNIGNPQTRAATAYCQATLAAFATAARFIPIKIIADAFDIAQGLENISR